MVVPTNTADRDGAEQYNTLLAFWLGALVYGLYCVLFIHSVKIMVRRRRSHRAWPAMVFSCATYLIFILTTIYMGLNISRFLYAFSPEWTEASNGKLPIYHLRDYTPSPRFAKMVIMAILIWLGDALTIFRCFIIWDKNWWVVLAPIILWTFSVSNSSIVTMEFHNPNTLPPQLVKSLNGIIFPVNIALICLTTGLITFRIGHQYRLSRAAGLRRHGRGVGLLTIIKIVVESAMIFAFHQISICIAFYIGNPGLRQIFTETLVSSIGATFALITIRVEDSKHEATSQFTLPHIYSAKTVSRLRAGTI
ncbi:hypothetical protein DFP72DRAFT_1162490 [Ephemerocybe angulata]|uniref:Uncharacterized protein n=1 Tax=Ephemerocybe angulata TaxID=980116 RepID=A0A8H6IHJ5_9AGAR|nr:hypothetical protein DFP72DRAFT_1162490 [Tulosesus angulatus]